MDPYHVHRQLLLKATTYHKMAHQIKLDILPVRTSSDSCQRSCSIPPNTSLDGTYLDHIPLHVVNDGRSTSYESGSTIAVVMNDCTPKYLIMSTG
jgi:hypothetical protein